MAQAQPIGGFFYFRDVTGSSTRMFYIHAMDASAKPVRIFNAPSGSKAKRDEDKTYVDDLGADELRQLFSLYAHPSKDMCELLGKSFAGGKAQVCRKKSKAAAKKKSGKKARKSTRKCSGRKSIAVRKSKNAKGHCRSKAKKSRKSARKCTGRKSIRVRRSKTAKAHCRSKAKK